MIDAGDGVAAKEQIIIIGTGGVVNPGAILRAEFDAADLELLSAQRVHEKSSQARRQHTEHVGTPTRYKCTVGVH